MPSARPLTPAERVLARVLTGPLGHLYAGVVDWASLAARLGAPAVRRRLSAAARRAATRRARP